MSWRAALWLAACLLSGGAEVRAEVPWALEAPERASVGEGEVTQLVVVLRAGGRYHVAPVGVVLELAGPERGLGLRQRRYHRGDASGDEGEAATLAFSVAVRGEAAGAHELGLRARFWACTPRLCVPVDQRRTIAITVEPPPVEPPPAPPPTSEPAPTPRPKAAPKRSPKARPAVPVSDSPHSMKP